MKSRILLLSLIAFITFSCNSSDNTPVPPPQPTSFLKANFNGVEQNFDIIKVVKNNLVAEDGIPYTDLIVTCNKTNDPTIKVVFNLASLESGDDTCYYFDYSIDDVDYYYDRDAKINNGFSINVSSNTETNIKGTFSGKLYVENSIDMPSVTVDNGSFDITF